MFLEVSQKIRAKYGTVSHFARMRNIKPEVLKQYVQGNFKSAKLEALLKEEKFIKDSSELGR